MKNAIYKICERLKGYSEKDEYFEVLEIEEDGHERYIVTVRAVDAESEKGGRQ